MNGSLKGASINRLACLFRHWTWADEAWRDSSESWQRMGVPTKIRLPIIYSVRTTIGVRCCAVSARRRSSTDFCRGRGWTRSVPTSKRVCLVLQACRQLLVVIPASREEHPRIVDLFRDDEMLGRLRRVHCAFGEALREEQMSRELDFLDTQER